MRNRTPKLLAFALAAVMTMGMTVSAAEIDRNEEGQTIDVPFGDTLIWNWGTVKTNEGNVQSNYGNIITNKNYVMENRGVVTDNHGTVWFNYSDGTVTTNHTDGIVESNGDTVTTNNGTVTNNNSDGTVTTNNGTVKNNYGIVENNCNIVENNYGTVKNVGAGYVVNNFGGDVEGGVDAQYYELPVPQNFSYEGAEKSDDRWWINFLRTVTIKAADDYYFESASISEGLGTITVADDHKSCTLSNVTGSLANGGLTLDVQEGEYTPEQPEPEPEPTPTPDPTPTTPPADTSTAAEPASAPTVQQMEQRERPDPQDVEAAERYNFWMGVKADLRAAADGKTLRVHVPAAYTNMPASVMEVIRLQDEDIAVDLRWSGEQLIITPATAQRKTALKAFWTFEQLCELYAQ